MLDTLVRDLGWPTIIISAGFIALMIYSILKGGSGKGGSNGSSGGSTPPTPPAS